MDRGELEGFDRESLVIRAQAAGIRRARILTRPELMDELLRLDPNADEAALQKSRGFFGRARDLVARVVERGLHLPDAADRIRTIATGQLTLSVPRTEPQAMPTVTLAEIYAAQGHRERAIETLRRVLDREPEHAAASALLARLDDEAYVAPPPRMAPEHELEAMAALAEQALEGGEEPGEPRIASDDRDDKPTLQHGAQTPPVTPVALEFDGPQVDECFAIPIGEGRMYARWNVSSSTLGALLGARPGGCFVVRAYIVTPAWDGPHGEVRDLVVDPDDGEATLRALPEPAVVRAAVGWLDGAVFVPLAHSPSLEMSRVRGLVIWTPKGMDPVILDDPRSASIARALDASRRAASRDLVHA